MSSMEWRYDAKEVSALIKGLTSVPKLLPGIIIKWLTRITGLLHVRVAKKAGTAPFPRYTGAAAASISTKKVVGTKLNFRGEVLSSITHITAVERGHRPGTSVPYDDLLTWVTVRAKRGELKIDSSLGSASKRTGGGLKARSSADRTLNAYARVAALIVLKIKKSGSKGYFIFEKTFKESQKAIDKMIKNMAEEIQRVIGKK